jgi:hypothetical protein
MAIDPDDPTTRYNVACFYAQIGELDKALGHASLSLPLSGHVKREESYDAPYPIFWNQERF